jgi:hypothetical protein
MEDIQLIEFQNLTVRLFNMYWITNITTRIYLSLGGNRMIFVTIFVSLIVGGRRTIEDVPPNIKEDVLADLELLGLDGYGKPLTK